MEYYNQRWGEQSYGVGGTQRFSQHSDNGELSHGDLQCCNWLYEGVRIVGIISGSDDLV